MAAPGKEHNQLLSQYRIRKSVEAIVDSEMTRTRIVYKRVKQNKMNFLIQKQELSDDSYVNENNETMRDGKRQTTGEREKVAYRKSEITNMCNSVIIHDREIPPSYSLVPRIYGGVEIDDNEKAALTLPPKLNHI